MKDRIKQLRKMLSLTQADFGASIGVKGNTITNYETGLRTPSDSVILSICREFNVSEQWLRTGEGEPFVPLSRDEEIMAFVGSAMRGDSDNFRRRLLSALARIPADRWPEIEAFAWELLGGKKEEQE